MPTLQWLQVRKIDKLFVLFTTQDDFLGAARLAPRRFFILSLHYMHLLRSRPLGPGRGAAKFEYIAGARTPSSAMVAAVDCKGIGDREVS